MNFLKEHFDFTNTEYKPEWIQGEDFEAGSAIKTGNGSWSVYDGKQNYMGKIKPDGGFVSNGPGEPDEYEETFLRAAWEELQRRGDE